MELCVVRTDHFSARHLFSLLCGGRLAIIMGNDSKTRMEEGLGYGERRGGGGGVLVDVVGIGRVEGFDILYSLSLVEQVHLGKI